MGDFFVNILNGLIKDLAAILAWLINLLPLSPFEMLSNSPVGQYLPGINWIIPVQTLVDIGTAWLTCIGIYYAYMIIMRWVKAIE